MNIINVSIPTRVARPGMTVGEAMQECVDKDVPGIPYVDAEGELNGRFSLRHLFLLCCIPNDILQGAHLLGDDIEHIDFPRIRADELLQRPVEEFIFPDVIRLSPHFHSIKALAIMEQFGTEYLFVTDEGEYRGVVTRMSIARALVDKKCCID
ncbi:MAG: CBS domain-containing protein [Candidatus Thiodiazotropha sp.]